MTSIKIVENVQVNWSDISGPWTAHCVCPNCHKRVILHDWQDENERMCETPECEDIRFKVVTKLEVFTGTIATLGCVLCKGTGELRVAQDGGLFAGIPLQCFRCNGHGKLHKDKLPDR